PVREGFEPSVPPQAFCLAILHRRWTRKNIAGHGRTLCIIVMPLCQAFIANLAGRTGSAHFRSSIPKLTQAGVFFGQRKLAIRNRRSKSVAHGTRPRSKRATAS